MSSRRTPTAGQVVRDLVVPSPASRTSLRRKAHKVARLLHANHGSPHHDNKLDPLDELVFIVLSQMTTHWSFGRVYDRLRGGIRSWEVLLQLPLRRVKNLIKGAGLSHQKAPRILSIFRRLQADFGTLTLEPLRDLSDAKAERYLTSLPGIGRKSAKCVLMYSFGRRVLPVDTHVWRVARRLGLVDPKTPYTMVHAALEAAVAPQDRYSFHVNSISHGRALCLPKSPRCSECFLRSMCSYYRELLRGGLGNEQQRSRRPADGRKRAIGARTGVSDSLRRKRTKRNSTRRRSIPR